MANAILCDYCEALNEVGTTQCASCGKPLFRECRSCGEVVARYYAKCPYCRRSTGRTKSEGGQDMVGRLEGKNTLLNRIRKTVRRWFGGPSG